MTLALAIILGSLGAGTVFAWARHRAIAARRTYQCGCARRARP